jgi:hypothetical protein
MVRVFGRDDAPLADKCRLGFRRRRLQILLEDPADGRGAEMRACPSERLGDLDLAHCRAESFEALDGVSDEVGESVEGRAKLHQRVGALLIEPAEPTGDRRGRDEECLDRLLQRPPSRGLQFENRQAFGGGIEWAARSTLSRRRALKLSAAQPRE